MFKHKILIAGSRSFTDYRLLAKKTDQILSNLINDATGLLIIAGGANGADTLAARYAADNQIPLLTIPAEWKRHGKGAGMIRNRTMGKLATHAIIFYDGKSKGSSNMIEYCETNNIPHRIIRF